jgi:hypothetical protein
VAILLGTLIGVGVAGIPDRSASPPDPAPTEDQAEVTTSGTSPDGGTTSTSTSADAP